jgi:hypothetical protein
MSLPRALPLVAALTLAACRDAPTVPARSGSAPIPDASVATASYSVTFLPAPRGHPIFAHSIARTATTDIVVGALFANDGSNISQAYWWTPGQPLHVLPNPVSGNDCEAYGVNRSRVIVGTCSVNGINRAVVWVPGRAPRVLALLAPYAGYDVSVTAYSINDQGRAVGAEYVCCGAIDGNVASWQWSGPTGIHELPHYNDGNDRGTGAAKLINNAGWIVTDHLPGNVGGLIYSPGPVLWGALPPAANVTQNSLSNEAPPTLLYFDVNYGGLRVTRLTTTACTATDASLRNLAGNNVRTDAFGINDRKQAVALNLIWSLGPTYCVPQRLPTPRGAAPGYGAISAVAINNLGHVAGNVYTTAGVWRAILWRPQ